MRSLLTLRNIYLQFVFAFNFSFSFILTFQASAQAQILDGESKATVEYQYSSWTDETEFQNCQQKLELVSQRLQGIRGVSVVQKKCGDIFEIRDQNGSLSLRPLMIRYKSLQPIDFSVVQFGRDFQGEKPEDYIGAFDSIQDCRAAINPLSEQFSTQLLVPVIDAYCVKGLSRFSLNNSGYVLKIIGAPTSKDQNTKLNMLGIRYISELGSNQKELIDDLVSRVRKQKGVIAHVSNGYIWYYSQQNAAIKIWELTGLENENSCEDQKTSVLKSLSKLGTKVNPSIYCLKNTAESGGSHRSLILMNGSRVVQLSVLPIEGYSFLNDCIEDLPRLERNLFNGSDRGNLFRESLGVVCVTASVQLDPKIRFEAKVIEAWR